MNNNVYCTNCEKVLTDNDEILVLELDFLSLENIFCSNECLIRTQYDVEENYEWVCHLMQRGDKSWLKIKYGLLPKDDWQSYISYGFAECMRVLKPTGTLLFKWSSDQISFRDVFKAIGQKPILGDRRGRTRWSVFIKGKEKCEL